MNKLLSFTQLENKSINIKKEEIDVEDFVKRYIDTFKIKYPDFKLNYKINGCQILLYRPGIVGQYFSKPDRECLQIFAPAEKGAVYKY